MNKAVDFVHAKVDEFGWRVFGEAPESLPLRTSDTDTPKALVGGGSDVLSKPNSRVLRKNLIDAGEQIPDYPHAAHHIVAGSSPKATEARKILQKYG